MSQEDKPCSQHPDAPHGFDRNASHNAGRYVCECEGWEPVAAQEPFCYMSDQFEVGLFTEPPTDPVFADMFPVYRIERAGRIDALESECRKLRARLEKAEPIVAAARNLIEQKGRHNTEIAYKRLADAIAKERT